ncbi:MAG TPA: hypothetical protein VGC55_12795 [Dokdonella sp.]
MGVSQNGHGNGAAPQRYAIGVDPALSAQVRRELLDTLHARTQFDPEQAERELAARDMHKEFIRVFGDLGLIPDNLPDLLAGHLMAIWTVVHDAPLPGRDIAAALVRQFTDQIAPSPLAADPAKRQLMGEALLYEAVLTLEAHEAARNAGNKTALKEMAESAQSNFLRQRAINLRKTRLTKAGMVRV